MDYIELIGVVAGILTSFSFLPQVIKAYNRKSVEDISWAMVIALTTGIFLWLIYGLLIDDLPIIFANIIGLALNAILLTMMLIYRQRSTD